MRMGNRLDHQSAVRRADRPMTPTRPCQKAQQMVGMARDLFFPRGCAGCDKPDAVLCPACRAQFNQVRERHLPETLTGRIWVAAAYEHAARQAILAWKDHGDVELDKPFARILVNICRRCAVPQLRKFGSAYGSILVVPAPSSLSSMRRRGRCHMMPLARAVARDLCAQGFNAYAAAALVSVTTGGRSVQQRSAAQRARRVCGHIRIDRRVPVCDAMVIVVDDIVTTGNTLRQSVATLTQAGAVVLCALALAEAISYRRDDNDSYDEASVEASLPAAQTWNMPVTTPQISVDVPSAGR